MGGRGASGRRRGGGGGGAIGNNPPIELQNERSRSSGNRWKYTVLSAESDSNGNITLNYASADSYENVNRNTTRAKYNLNAGVYDQPGNRTIRDHNINWDKVNSVSGSTYDVRNYIKGKGFVWDNTNKRWVRR